LIPDPVPQPEEEPTLKDPSTSETRRGDHKLISITQDPEDSFPPHFKYPEITRLMSKRVRLTVPKDLVDTKPEKGPSQLGVRVSSSEDKTIAFPITESTPLSTVPAMANYPRPSTPKITRPMNSSVGAAARLIGSVTKNLQAQASIRPSHPISSESSSLSTTSYSSSRSVNEGQSIPSMLMTENVQFSETEVQEAMSLVKSCTEDYEEYDENMDETYVSKANERGPQPFTANDQYQVPLIPTSTNTPTISKFPKPQTLGPTIEKVPATKNITSEGVSSHQSGQHNKKPLEPQKIVYITSTDTEKFLEKLIQHYGYHQ